MIKDEFYTLSGGIKMPKVGLGTWQSSASDAYSAVRAALDCGYTHIDTAYAYGNESAVGKAVKDSGVAREKLFITTKLPSDIKTYAGAVETFEKSLENLDCGYIDLYLIHAPWPWSDVGRDCAEGNKRVWQAFLKLKSEGKIRAAGVSNFHGEDIEPLISDSGETPEVNQIRFFVGNIQKPVYDYCNLHGIRIQAYSPMATGAILQNGTLEKIAAKYGVSLARLCVRYCLEKGTAPLPKSVHAERIRENIMLDFALSAEDMLALDALEHIGPTRPYRS